MGYNFTGPVTVPNSRVTLMSLLITGGYDGPSVLQNGGVIYNTDGTNAIYIHFTNSGSTQPTTATDGMPILTSAPSAMFSLPKGTDLSTTWVYGAASLTAKVAIIN